MEPGEQDVKADGRKLNVTLASSNEGWDKAVNGQFLVELASNSRVKVSGFVPKSTQQQREDAKKLGIELVDAKEIPGYSPSELLAYPPDSLDIDILMIHSYGRDVGRQAQIIKQTKNCKWLHVLHTVSEELVKFTNEHESEHEIQLELCQQADIVWADKIKNIRAKDPKTRNIEAEELRKEYIAQFNWKDQCDKLVEKMFTMIPTKHGQLNKCSNFFTTIVADTTNTTF
ncbi:hypothetical protein OS493_016863 [Desmophyllum pertusum]|uniref:Uncharacterized protein n=1 Tax=Desmophyllum pertusum TaxID=174260 RepID=A0A9X0CMF6_9CNID|nr:hypothetical protein OS493_016863 [Desmophyllum pertusum]